MELFKINPKFHNTYLRLTLFYVLIIMTISVSFSVFIYQISTSELNRGLGRQARILQNLPMDELPVQIQNFDQIREDQITQSNENLRANLIYFNLLILLLSSLLSYFLARKNLEPIEEAMEAQNRFTADASHELRTPLTVMRTEIEVTLRDKNLKLDEAKKLLGSNLEEIGKLESLAGALLKLAKNEDAKVNFQKVDLEKVMTESYEKVESLAAKKSITIECNPEMGCYSGPNSNTQTFYTRGDKQSLVELFIILLDNAIKYSPENSKISINLEKIKDDIHIKIKDEGIGIKSSDIPFIFNRFYRADSSRSKETISGYGLGLSIAKQIVDLHKGTISVESHPGKGSVFGVILESDHL